LVISDFTVTGTKGHTEGSKSLTKYLARIRMFLKDRECNGDKSSRITSGVEKQWFHISPMIKKMSIYTPRFLNYNGRPSFLKAGLYFF
jgi:hypothetical protein